MRGVVWMCAVAWAAACLAVAPANRPAQVDAQGVMRWTDDGSEVAVFGVNYYAPFALDYRVLRERGHDIKETIRRDIRRLDSVCLCFGKWLDPSAAGRAHSFEISAIRVE